MQQASLHHTVFGCWWPPCSLWAQCGCTSLRLCKLQHMPHGCWTGIDQSLYGNKKCTPDFSRRRYAPHLWEQLSRGECCRHPQVVHGQRSIWCPQHIYGYRIFQGNTAMKDLTVLFFQANIQNKSICQYIPESLTFSMIRSGVRDCLCFSAHVI